MNFAGPTAQVGLRNRDFEVVRLNTYDTVPVEQLAEEELQLAKQAKVIAFASPSAVKAWHRLTGPCSPLQPLPACIGAPRCNTLGMRFALCSLAPTSCPADIQRKWSQAVPAGTWRWTDSKTACLSLHALCFC